MPTKSNFKKIRPNHHFKLFWQYRNQPADTRADHCPYCESREVVKRGPHQVIRPLTLNHQQVYYYRYHQANLEILLNQRELSHHRFHDLAAYLTLIEKYCPHNYFEPDPVLRKP